jgi:hypothetical protein
MTFKAVLSECLERIRRGDSVEACLEGSPGHAAQLQPYLAAAGVLRAMRVPAPGEGKARARSRLMGSVAAGSGKEDVVRGILRFAHVAGAAFGGLFLLGFGIVAASGPDALNPFGGDKPAQHADEIGEFKGEVREITDEQLAIVKGEDATTFSLTDDTRFHDEKGAAINRTGVEEGSFVFVKAVRDGEGWIALKVRLVDPDGGRAKPSATPAAKDGTPTPAATTAPVPEATPAGSGPGTEPEPQPTDLDEGPAATEKVFEGWVKEVHGDAFLLKNPADHSITTVHFNGETAFDGPLTAGSTVRVVAWVYADGTIVARSVQVTAIEFVAGVVSVGSGQMVVNSEWGQVVVHTAGAHVEGTPFAGVKVIIWGTKNGDGSVNAGKVAVKLGDLAGVLTAKGPASITVNASGTNKVIGTNGSTAWDGEPFVGAEVLVVFYKMADGSYLAKEVHVKGSVFTGTITAHNPAEFIINVQVEAQTRVVCYEFADVIGTLAVGKTVQVHVSHVEGGTHFASLVKVLN